MRPALIDGGSLRAQLSLLLVGMNGQTSSLTGAKWGVKVDKVQKARGLEMRSVVVGTRP